MTFDTYGGTLGPRRRRGDPVDYIASIDDVDDTVAARHCGICGRRVQYSLSKEGSAAT